jgi:hypothetical protein
VSGWLKRELGGLFYTFYELFFAARLRRFAPYLASILLVAAAGVVLLVILDMFAVAYGKVTTAPLSHTPRSIAAVAIVGGYYIWDRFAGLSLVLQDKNGVLRATGRDVYPPQLAFRGTPCSSPIFRLASTGRSS